MHLLAAFIKSLKVNNRVVIAEAEPVAAPPIVSSLIISTSNLFPSTNLLLLLRFDLLILTLLNKPYVSNNFCITIGNKEGNLEVTICLISALVGTSIVTKCQK